MSIISVDIGGTKMLAGIVSRGQVSKLVKQNTKIGSPKAVINQQLVDLVAKMFNSKIRAICLALPGIVDSDKGILRNAPNIPNWENVPVRKILSRQFNCPIYLINDANAFALGEKYFGQGKNSSSLVGITLGTGLGTGVIINNKLYTGHHGGAGEFGRMVFRQGVWEHYASGQFFEKFYHTNGEVLFKQAKQGNKPALKAFQEFGHNLAEGLSIISRAIDPQIIIIGGSIAASRKYFQDSMMENFDRILKPRHCVSPKIKFSRKPNIALLGCSVLPKI